MNNQELIQSIIQDIKISKKYRSIYGKTIERIVADYATRYKKPAEIEKKSKNLLHQIWGAFYSTRPDFSSLAQKFTESNPSASLRASAEMRGSESVKEIVLPLLNLQSSVKERIPLLDDFYKKIFEVTGVPNSIIDYACGLNPLTYFWMDLPETSKYQAFDIDQEEVDFLNSIFKLLAVQNVNVAVGDVLVDELEEVYPEQSRRVDVVLLLKLLPCLEHQKKDAGIELIKKLQCKYVVVSFPIKSIGGKNVGMADFYSKNFKNVVEMEHWDAKEILFSTELVFVIKKYA